MTQEDYREVVKKMRLISKYPYNTKESAKFYCPFHTEKTPSMIVNFKLGIYHCFGCDKGGTINQLVREHTSKSINELLGIEADFNDFNRKPPREIQKKIVTPLDIRGRIKPYHTSESAKAYVKGRGITDDVALKATIGYCSQAYINGTSFRDRVMIPIYDDKNRMINVEGRAINKDELKCLYPLNGTKPIYEYYCLDKTKPLYLFEGIIKMLVARTDPYFSNSSSTLGSNLSEYQQEQLNEFSSVILIRDMDIAGHTMAVNLKEIYKSKLKVMLLKGGVKDIDEIPTHLHTTVKEFRESGGIQEDIEFM